MTQSQLKSSLRKTCNAVQHQKVYCDFAKLVGSKIESGLFAKCAIKAGETIFVAKGTTVRINIKNKNDSAKYPNAIGVGPGEWLDPHANNPLVFLNHSCRPNAGIKGSVTFVALRNIKKGEEVTIDYSITEQDTLWTLDAKCHCGEPNCRKVIRSIQSLPVRIYSKYLPYVPTKMQTAYRKAHRDLKL